jgi:hypothetical protein
MVRTVGWMRRGGFAADGAGGREEADEKDLGDGA